MRKQFMRIAAAYCLAALPLQESEAQGIKELIGDRFEIGVGVGVATLDDPENATLIERHFSILTPENCMKPQGIHPLEGTWNFDPADRFARFARDKELNMVGHCLVWAKDDRTAEWMRFEDGQPVSRETLLQRVESHIHTVVERYADVVTMWDVVNEAIGDSGDGLLRDSIYSRATGIDFIVTAFQAARAKDPDALLIYNDYNGHKPSKREKLLMLLKELKARGAPVDAYGMQGHFELGDEAIEELRTTFEALKALGLKIVISELDIDVVTRGRWWADDGQYRDELVAFDPYETGLPGRIQQRLAQEYFALFELFDEYGDIIERVSFWNLHDGESWLNEFPWTRTNHPLLFDRDRAPKPAFDAVYEALRTSPREHRAIERQDQNSLLAHRDLITKAHQGIIDVYFQGDSITRRWGATDYPGLLEHWRAQWFGWNAANFAWGGDNTHNILWRMRHGEFDGLAPKVVVVQAGANNLPWRGPADPATIDNTISGIRAILSEVRERAPNAELILTAMFPRTQNRDLAPAIKAINQRIESIARWMGIRFVNINDRLVNPSGDFLPGMSNDGLHLEEGGYEVWAQALSPIFEEILGPRADVDHAPPPTGNPAAR